MVEPLLSDLCKICHINLPKYLCPRCATRTCSLPCIKRHKLWAQCNGVRDPAAYVKRNELATPSGIDRDYNFITSIERKIDGAERDTEERGIILVPQSETRKSQHKQVKGEVQMKDALARCGVIIDRAPKGMTRSKQNATNWAKKRKCIKWTVEWIDEDGRKGLGTCYETEPVAEAYAMYSRRTQPQGTKRKRCSELNDPPQPHIVSSGSTPSQSSAKSRPVPSSAQPDPTISLAGAMISHDTSAEHANTLSIQGPTSSESHPEITSPRPPLYFYLHRPHTPCTSRVVVPLSPSATLSTTVKDRVVLEFPTIHVMPNPPDKLPEAYMLERDFIGWRGKEEGEIEELIRMVASPREDGTREMEGRENERGMDAERLFAVLKTDLSGA